jgi:hypothetical protein
LGAGEMDLQVILVFAPSLSHKSNTHDQHSWPTLMTNPRPDDLLKSTVHHSFDPLGAGEIDLQVILGSFGHWWGGLWLRSLKNSPVFAPSLSHKSNSPSLRHKTIRTRCTLPIKMLSLFYFWKQATGWMPTKNFLWFNIFYVSKRIGCH